ncbi:hypothetical protein EG68_00650 [Paragonimus skrjabini miyazakii]|uniref:Ras-specific guanine nucleotide-releasing factor 1 n=1 Tax=Paragonimus skrjabini miyazakii TaxID=59628 RepID=A0A8S9ZCJ8_9TREM|nr:hypothetical protein EG68_00650 [Paragonimus skrjabini miyazakii]
MNEDQERCCLTHSPFYFLPSPAQIMHDEVSETENIRKNLAIERMIVDGCDLLLDVNQVFVRQGKLIQVICDKQRSSRSRLGPFGASSRERKEAVRQVFLFTNHLLITARTNNGRLRLVKNCGKVSLVECTLVEDTSATLFNTEDDEFAVNEQNINSQPDRRIQETSSSATTRSSNITNPFSAPGSPPPPSTTYAPSTPNLITSPLTDIALSPKSSLRSDCGPQSAGCTTRLFLLTDNARSRHTSSFTGSTTAASQTCSGPMSQSWSDQSTSVQHRHSTSLCITSGVNPVDSEVRSPGIARTSLLTSQPTADGTSAVVSGQSQSFAGAMPLIHRFSSNFGALHTIPNSSEKTDYGNMDFRLIWEPKNGPQTSIWLVASTLQEKAAWCSDISQCIEQLHYGDILNSAQSDVSSVAMPQSIRSDPRLFKDDVDIKFSHTLNSCKVPQIRHATVDRLLDRLTDARFLSIDFLNTFLLTYRVFTTGLTVIWALQQVLANPEVEGAASLALQQQHQQQQQLQLQQEQQQRQQAHSRQSTQLSTVSHFNSVDSQIPYESGGTRYSDTSYVGRLPVLEERHSRIDDSQSKSDNPDSEVDEEEEHLTPSIAQKNGLSTQSARPVSTLGFPDCRSADPQTTSPQRMSHSETTYGQTQCESTLSSKKTSPHLDLETHPQSKYEERTKKLPSCPTPPPLIPRSPVFGSLFNMREDPPLQLPNLEELIAANKQKKHTEGNTSSGLLRTSSSTDHSSTHANVHHARLAPLASCEVTTMEEPDAYVRTEYSSDPEQEFFTQEQEWNGNDSLARVNLQRRRLHSEEYLSHGVGYLISTEAERKQDTHQLNQSSREFTDLSATSTDDQLVRPLTKPKQSCLRWTNGTHANLEFNSSFTTLDRLVHERAIPNYRPLSHPRSMISFDDSHRLVENYLNQNVGAPCSKESAVRQPVQTEELPGSPNEVSRMKTTTDSSNVSDSKRFIQLSPIADGLDLATRIFRKDASQKSACQTLAKSAMLAALNCPGGLVRMEIGNKNFMNTTRKSTRIDWGMTNGNAALNAIQSSPASPKQCYDGLARIKITKASYRFHPSVSQAFGSVVKWSNASLGAPAFHPRHLQTQSPETRSDCDLRSPRHTTRDLPVSPILTKSHLASPVLPPKTLLGHSETNEPSVTTSTTNPERDQCGKYSQPQNSDVVARASGLNNQINMACDANNVGQFQVPLRNTGEGSVTERTGISSPRSSYGQLQNSTIDYARGSVVSWSGVSTLHKPKRPSVFSCPDTDVMSSRPSMDLSSFVDPTTSLRTRAGAVVTSSRRSKRRSSNTAAAQAFAVATAGSASPLAATGIMGFGAAVPRLNFRFTAGTASSAASTIVKPIPSSSTTTAIGGAPTSLNSMTRHSTSSSPNHFTSTSTQPGISGPLISGSSRFTGRNSSVGTNGTSLMTQSLNTTLSGGSSIVHLSQAAQTSMDQKKRRSMIMATASCLRVLNVVRHWITKFPDDFDSDPVLKQKMKGLLETLVSCQHLLPNDQRAAGQLLRQMVCDQLVQNRVDLDDILTPTQISSEKNFSTLSALDISEQLTFLDFQIFRSIRSEELLNQSWMKPDKEEKAKHVLLVCKRFNEVSRLVVSEIISRTDLNDRVLCIEKWVAIADICRCLQNYNGVLQICAALVNSSVYRLRRTWERVSKQTKQSIDRLQMLVASDGRFKSMREALHRCDPPCIPYLGMYLTDLSFIEEGALNVTESDLVNFCKMRMIAHVIREIQQFHQTPYLISHKREVS